MNWKRLTAEFIVIFLGVTASFVAEDWREVRDDRRAELSALEQIHDELVADSIDLANVRPGLRRHRRSAAWIRSVESRLDVPRDSVAAALRTLAYHVQYQPRRATLQSLQATGGLGLVSDDMLRRDILRYYEEEQAKVFHFRAEHNELATRLYETWWLHVRHRSRQDPETPLTDPPPTVEFVGSWRDLRADARILNWIAGVGTIAGITSDYIDDQIELNVALRQRIRAVLEEG